MSETAMLQGVRDILRSVCGFSDTQCDIEIDEFAPSVASDLYVVVMPGGWQPGPNNLKGGGVLDEIYGCDVDVILARPKVPRDRTRNLLTNPTGGQDALGGLNFYLRKIIAAMHFQYSLMMVAINGYITDSTEKFIEPLKFIGVDRKPRVIGPEVFAATPTDQRSALARTARFGGLRRIQYHSSQV